MYQIELRTVPEAAQQLRVCRTTVYRLFTTGQLKPVHIGKSVRVTQSELNRFISSLTGETPDVSSNAETLQGVA